ncbi:MAG: SH3 domain-containing protein [Cyanobacteriota bacterium]|nr:SH3 domain-containing protein [Cyanobacteriota bacterium]
MNRNPLLTLAISAVAIGLTNCSNATPPAPNQPVTPPTTPADPVSQTPTPDPTASPTPDPTAAPTPAPTPAPNPAPNPVTEAPTTAEQPAPEPEPQPADVRTISCITTTAIVDDPDAPLNVRSSPITGDVVGKLDNGAIVNVEREADNWLQIDRPINGWISKNLTQSSCNQKVARVNFAGGTTVFTLDDRIVGTGNHQYLLEASQGQTLTLTAQDGPLPYIIAPSGEEVTGGVGFTGASQWSGELPASGEYRIELTSNFRGFTYNTAVDLR